MDLINAYQKAKILQAIQNVTDTFFQRPVVFRSYPLGYDAMGRLVKDPVTNQPKRVDVTVKTFVETKETFREFMKFVDSGPAEEYDYVLTFNTSDFHSAGLLDDNQQWLFDLDWLVIFDNEFHQIVWRNLDGQLKDSSVLAVIAAKRLPANGDY